MLALNDDLLSQVVRAALCDEEVWCQRMHLTNKVLLSVMFSCRRLRGLVRSRLAAWGVVSLSTSNVSMSRLIVFLERLPLDASVVLWGGIDVASRQRLASLGHISLAVECRQRWSYSTFYYPTVGTWPKSVDSVRCRGSGVIVRRPVRTNLRAVPRVSSDEYNSFVASCPSAMASLTVSQVLVGSGKLEVGVTVPECVRVAVDGRVPVSDDLRRLRHLHVVPIGQRYLTRRYESGRLASVLSVSVSQEQVGRVSAFVMRECEGLSWVNLDSGLCDDGVCAILSRRVCPTVGVLARILYTNRGVVSCGYSNRIEYIGHFFEGGAAVCYLRLNVTVDASRLGFMFDASFFGQLTELLCRGCVVGGRSVRFVVRDLTLVFDTSNRSLCGFGTDRARHSVALAVVSRCRALYEMVAPSVHVLGLFQFGALVADDMPLGIKDLVMRVMSGVPCPSVRRVRADVLTLHSCVWYLRSSPVASLRIVGGVDSPSLVSGMVQAVALWWKPLVELCFYVPDIFMVVRHSCVVELVVMFMASLPSLGVLHLSVNSYVPGFGEDVQRQCAKLSMSSREVQLVVCARVDDTERSFSFII